MCTEKSSLQIGEREIPIEIGTLGGYYTVSEPEWDLGMPLSAHWDKQTAIELFRELLEDAEAEGGRPFDNRAEYRRDAQFSAILRGAQS